MFSGQIYNYYYTLDTKVHICMCMYQHIFLNMTRHMYTETEIEKPMHAYMHIFV